MPFRSVAVVLMFLLGISGRAWTSSKLEDDLVQIFVGRSFTIRNFYRGTHLRYGSDGQLLEKAEAGYWSRDGMVEFSSVKVVQGTLLIMEGKRTCVELDQRSGEFSNVATGDRVQIEVQLTPDQLNTQAILPLLQKVLLSSRDRLVDLVPPYWTNCLSRKVDRRDKRSPWECAVTDKTVVPDFERKKITWDFTPPDTSLHTGTRRYLIRHKVAYLTEPGVKDPSLGPAQDPIFAWDQNRTKLGEMTLVLAFTVSEAGRARDIMIVSPVGMGIDDDAVKALSTWQFTPAVAENNPRAVHARVTFEISPTH